MPPQVPSIARAAEPSDAPTSSSEPARSPGSTWTEAFASERYGYSIHYPFGWTAVQSESRSRPDSFTSVGHTHRLQIDRRAKPSHASLAEFVADSFPTTCPGVARAPRWITLSAGSRQFAPAVIDGYHALVRSYCWNADAVVDLGEDFLVMTLIGGGVGPRGDRSTLERFAERLQIGPVREVASSSSASPQVPRGEPFVSDRFGYSIRYPERWTAGRLELPPNSDRFSAPAPSRTRLAIVRRPKPPRLSLEDIADGTFQPHNGPDGCQWNTRAFIFIPVAQGSFDGAVVDGRPALVRSECGFVDAVIDAGDEVLIVVLRSGTPKPTGDDWWFARFMATIDIAVD